MFNNKSHHYNSLINSNLLIYFQLLLPVFLRVMHEIKFKIFKMKKKYKLVLHEDFPYTQYARDNSISMSKV